eukprot:7876826-Pyramimonas_sp.AAC.1
MNKYGAEGQPWAIPADCFLPEEVPQWSTKIKYRSAYIPRIMLRIGGGSPNLCMAMHMLSGFRRSKAFA